MSRHLLSVQLILLKQKSKQNKTRKNPLHSQQNQNGSSVKGEHAQSSVFPGMWEFMLLRLSWDQKHMFASWLAGVRVTVSLWRQETASWPSLRKSPSEVSLAHALNQKNYTPLISYIQPLWTRWPRPLLPGPFVSHLGTKRVWEHIGPRWNVNKNHSDLKFDTKGKGETFLRGEFSFPPQQIIGSLNELNPNTASSEALPGELFWFFCDNSQSPGCVMLPWKECKPVRLITQY